VLRPAEVSVSIVFRSSSPPSPPPLPFHAPMVSFPDLTKADGLAALDKHLASKSYVEG